MHDWIALLESAVREGNSGAVGADFERATSAGLVKGILASGGSVGSGSGPERRGEVRGFVEHCRALAGVRSVALVGGVLPPRAMTPSGALEFAGALFGSIDGAGEVDVESCMVPASEWTRFADDPGGPESRWYAQLVLLHAFTSFGVLRGHDGACRAAMEIADFVSAEIQPDHATALPWGLAGLAMRRSTWPTAEMVLNAVMVQYGGVPSGLALVLLAESLYVLTHARTCGRSWDD